MYEGIETSKTNILLAYSLTSTALAQDTNLCRGNVFSVLFDVGFNFKVQDRGVNEQTCSRQCLAEQVPFGSQCMK